MPRRSSKKAQAELTQMEQDWAMLTSRMNQLKMDTKNFILQHHMDILRKYIQNELSSVKDKYKEFINIIYYKSKNDINIWIGNSIYPYKLLNIENIENQLVENTFKEIRNLFYGRGFGKASGMPFAISMIIMKYVQDIIMLSEEDVSRDEKHDKIIKNICNCLVKCGLPLNKIAITFTRHNDKVLNISFYIISKPKKVTTTYLEYTQALSCDAENYHNYYKPGYKPIKVNAKHNYIRADTYLTAIEGSVDSIDEEQSAPDTLDTSHMVSPSEH